MRLLSLPKLAAQFFILQSITFSAPPTFATASDDRVDTYVKQQMVKYQIPGLSVAVVRNGKLLKLRSYGVASVEFDVRADERTVYQLFSVSKIFAGVAVMRLVEDGKLSLQTPITEFIENAPTNWQPIQIRHLLTHTSGLPELSANPHFACLPEDKKKQISTAEELKFLMELPLKFEPGEKFSYHQSGYRLLGMILEKVAKKSYADFLQERVFTRLGMTATQFGATDGPVIKQRSATSYNRQSGELRGWAFPFSVRDYPGAGLNSSAADLAKFLNALDSGKVLQPESLTSLWSRVKLNDQTEKDYGLGWTVDTYKGRKVVGHEGGGASWVAHFPNEHLSIIVLCNLNGARADEIQYGIADFYL